jgi:diguanylate cyclase (GGDEF)-like protein
MHPDEGSQAAAEELNRKASLLMMSSPEDALAAAREALALAGPAGGSRAAAEALLNVGRSEYYLTRLAPAIASCQKALDSFSALGEGRGVMRSLNALGMAYQDMGRYERAMDYYTRSLEESHKAGDRTLEAVTLTKIGEVCLELGEIKEAIDYFLRAYETVPDDDEPDLIANVLIDVGSAFHRMENWPLAREFTEKAMDIARSNGNIHVEGRCWHLLGLISVATDRPSLAEDQYLKALAVCERLKGERERAAVLLDLGAVTMTNGDVDLALSRFRTALASAEATRAKALINLAYERLSEAYELLGDHRLALDYYKRFARYQHEALNEDASRKIKNVTVQYEVEKSRQESEIYRLKNIELREKTEELESANRQILAIADTGRLITASLDLDTIVATLHDTLKKHIPFDVFALALYDESEGVLDYRGYIDRGKRAHRARFSPDPERSFEALCLRGKKPVFAPDVAAAYAELLKDVPTRKGASAKTRPEVQSGSAMFLPLIIDDRAIGMLALRGERRGTLDKRHLTLAEALAPYVAIAVENSLIHDRLEEFNRAVTGEKEALEKAAETITHLANHDPLTGLPNRRLLFELIQKTFDIASRNGTKVGVIYLDLDNFKPINDRLGHLAGDRALVAVAERLRSLLRAADTVARVGGDEFVAVLANVKERADIEMAAQKILEECNRSFMIDGSECRVGASLGIAVYPEDGSSLEEIVGAADSAMYRIKHGGKNGIAFAGDADRAPAAS